MNPATFLRVLGPERWRVCYVEPSVRPDDSRYGENPNRLQQHTQFQVRLPSLLYQHTKTYMCLTCCGAVLSFTWTATSICWILPCFHVRCCTLCQ